MIVESAEILLNEVCQEADGRRNYPRGNKKDFGECQLHCIMSI